MKQKSASSQRECNDVVVGNDFQNDSNKLDEYCQWLLHGNGHNRWYDKSFNMIILKNGKVRWREIFR